MATCATILVHLITEKLLMDSLNPEVDAAVTKALLDQFESHHERMCQMVQNRIGEVDEELKTRITNVSADLNAKIAPLSTKVGDLATDAATFKGALRMLKLILWLLPILCTVGAAVGALIGRN
jgi:hypothetical protein